jgi:four helix bundle protein
MKSVKDLEVYKIAIDLTIGIYKLTESFPRSETFGLTAQMRRAAISINSNLTEGCARGRINEYKHFASIAKGSASELAYQIFIANKLGFIKDSEYDQLYAMTDRVCRMLSGLLKSLSEYKITNNQQPTTNNR